MRLDQLHYLMEVANSGSITTAAEKLHVSQPNVSQSIANLEEEFNTRIFHRSRLGAQPTEVGKIIIEKAKEILHHVKDLERMVQNQNTNLVGNLSIAAVPSMCTTILPKALGAFKNNFPGIQIEIIEAGSIQIKDYILKGEVDIGLVSRRELSDYSINLTFEPLLPGEVMACVGKYSPLSNKKKLSPKEIIKYPIVIFNQEYRINSHITNLLKNYGEPNILFTARNPESVKKVIIEGLAIGFYSDIALKTDPYVQNGDIIPIHITEQKSNTFFGILNRKNTILSTASVEFNKELRIQANKFKRLYNIKDHS